MALYSGNPATLATWWADQQKADRREWMRVSSEVGEYLQVLSGRDDLLAVVEPGVALGNLAVYRPEMAHVEVDTDRCAEGVAPADIHMDSEVGRLAHPALTGACTHEGFHALASKWELDQSPEKRQVVQAALLLEEARAEKRGLSMNPDARTFLRAGFFDLVKGAGEVENMASAVQLCGLAMARVDAGVLDAAEMAGVKAEIIALLGQDLYDNLRKVWLKAHKVADDDQATMEALGQEWLDLLPEEAKDGGEGGVTVIVCGMPSEGKSESGEGEGEGKGKGTGAMAAAAAAVSEAADDEAAGKVGAAKVADAAAERKAAAADARSAEKAAKEVFERHLTGHAHGMGGSEGVEGHVAPAVQTRAMANMLARAIQRAQHRARSKTVLPSAVPPGRLRGAAAVRRSAQRAQGIPVTAQPWRQTVRKHVENPPIVCGIMMDVSGSMRWAERPVAEAAWAIAHAIHRNDGDSATVAYGNRVHAVVKPGESPKMQAVLNAGGGSEVPMQAFLALDGALNLHSGSGVRMLVVISDGMYTHHQKDGFTKQLRKLTATGAKVLWIDMAQGGSDPIRMPGIEVATIRHSGDLGKVIGGAITRALSAA